jgi:pimeloyl-ACP methyl ester carboxylesterase
MARALAREKEAILDRFDAPWLAIASELDAPWRPVNVGVTKHAQHDADVVVPGTSPVTVTARHAIVGDLHGERGIVLLLHGLGSRLEEVDVVAEALAERGLGVVAVDLPSQGYSSRVAPEHVGDPANGTYVMPEWDRDEGYSYLGFAERFVVAFAHAIGITDRLVAVGGGSLGGTLSLRLAIHGALGTNVRSIAWSPGSVWGTQQTNYVNWAAIEATAGRRLWRAESLADDEARSSHDSRTDYIRWVFESPFAAIVKPQPTLWFKGMPLEAEHTAAARADRRELYDHAHRVTCLALAYEQTIYSITETPRGQAHPRFASIGAPVLVMAGSRDDDMLDIHREVGKLAGRMRSHGRRGRIVRLDACHSIHEERPRTLAAEIDAFLGDASF